MYKTPDYNNCKLSKLCSLVPEERDCESPPRRLLSAWEAGPSRPPSPVAPESAGLAEARAICMSSLRGGAGAQRRGHSRSDRILAPPLIPAEASQAGAGLSAAAPTCRQWGEVGLPAAEAEPSVGHTARSRWGCHWLPSFGSRTASCPHLCPRAQLGFGQSLCLCDCDGGKGCLLR